MKSQTLLILIVAGAALLTALCLLLAAGEQRRLEAAVAAREGLTIETGARLFALHCRTCHGLRGEGVGQLGPPLADSHFFKERLKEVGWPATLTEYIVSSTEHGRMMGTRPIYAGNGSTAVMSPWHQDYGGPLRSDEIRAVTAYILNWRATAEGAVELEELELPRANPQDPAVVERGAAVFRRRCNGCHAHEKAGPAEIEGPDLTDLATVASQRREGMEGIAYIREAILIPEAHLVEGYERMAGTDGCGATLTETELTAVSAFLLQP